MDVYVKRDEIGCQFEGKSDMNMVWLLLIDCLKC